MLVVTQGIFKSHSSAIFQINLWRANLFLFDEFNLST